VLMYPLPRLSGCLEPRSHLARHLQRHLHGLTFPDQDLIVSLLIGASQRGRHVHQQPV